MLFVSRVSDGLASVSIAALSWRSTSAATGRASRISGSADDALVETVGLLTERRPRHAIAEQAAVQPRGESRRVVGNAGLPRLAGHRRDAPARGIDDPGLDAGQAVRREHPGQRIRLVDQRRRQAAAIAAGFTAVGIDQNTNAPLAQAGRHAQLEARLAAARLPVAAQALAQVRVIRLRRQLARRLGREARQRETAIVPRACELERLPGIGTVDDRVQPQRLAVETGQQPQALIAHDGRLVARADPPVIGKAIQRRCHGERVGEQRFFAGPGSRRGKRFADDGRKPACEIEQEARLRGAQRLFGFANVQRAGERQCERCKADYQQLSAQAEVHRDAAL